MSTRARVDKAEALGVLRPSSRGVGHLLVSIFVVVWPCIALALDAERMISQLPHVWYENQLQQNTVMAIAQHADGALWLGTYGGLVKYSGAEFENIDRDSAQVLRSSSITALYEDSHGVLWIGTLNGGLYRYATRTLEAVNLPAKAETVLSIAQDRSGALWLATNAGILRMRLGTTQFELQQGFPQSFYRNLAADAEGGIWLAADGTGIAHWREGKIELLDTKAGLPTNALFEVIVDPSGEVWAATQKGIVRYRAGRFERDSRLAALDDKPIFTMAANRDGSLWFAPIGAGLCRLTVTRFECDAALKGLGGESVRSMFEDREGNLWVGTTANGIHRFSDSKLVTITGSLASNSIRAVFEDHAGTIWVGTDGAGLVTYGDHRFESAAWNDKLPSKLIRTITADTGGNLWVGTMEGVTRIAADGRATQFGRNEGLPGLLVFALIQSRSGAMWAATLQGVAKIDHAQVSVVEGTRGSDARALHEDSEGRLWIGLRGGLRCWHSGVLDNCGTNGLPGVSVFAFYPGADGSLWLGTNAGLMRMHGDALIQYGKRTGLASESLFAILDDARGNFWLSSNRGIARLSRHDLDALDVDVTKTIEPTWYGKNDGMLASQCNGASQTPAMRARDGRLWIGTTNGVVMVDPEREHRNALAPPVSIERVSVDDAAADPDRIGRIGPGVNHIELHYAAMSFMAPAAVRYRYQLEGFDRKWIDASGRRVAYYTNLPAGDYIFHVIASNNDGVWNNEGARTHFTVVPHWYETWWFRVMVALVIAAVLAMAYRVRLWRLRENERALEREVALQTEALRQANAELHRLALLDGLTRIPNRREFDRFLDETWKSHSERAIPLAVLLCDIDAFKAYNDTYGHQAGDEALVQVAEALATVLRSHDDLAARYGGEELALVLSHCDAPTAWSVANKLLKRVRDLSIAHRTSDVAPYLTLSIGFCSMQPSSEFPPGAAVRRADAALYRAKSEGRDRICEALSNDTAI